MGLLDGFLGQGQDDPRSNQVMALAAGLLSARGSAGMSAGLSNMMHQTQQDQILKSKKAHDDMVMQAMQMDIEQKQKAISDQQRLQDFQKNFSAQQQDPNAQALQAMGGNLSPTVANAGTLNQLRGQASAQANDPYEQRMRMAQAYRQGGFQPQAEAEEVAALKFRPEFDQTPRVGTGADGKPFTYVMDKQGNPKVLSGILPRDEMKLMDNGGSQTAYNPFSIAPGQSFMKTQTADSKASNALGYARLRQDADFHKDAQANAAKPAWNNEVGAFIVAPDSKNPNGRQIPLSGYAKPDKPLTEFQGKASLFASRMENSNKIMSELNANGTKTPSLIKSTLEGVPLIGGGLGAMANFGANANQQKLEQSQRDFVNAVLRQESGAAISDGEFASAKKQYFPSPGDSDEVIAQKADNRNAAIKGMTIQAGPGAAQIGISKIDAPKKADATPKSLLVGQVYKGYKFKGGDKADPNSWEKQ